ncbi:MAG: inositol monophosphatase family protein [Thermoproteota archaeon]
MDLARRAGKHVASSFLKSSSTDFRFKSKHEIATAVDLEAESIILEGIKSIFPGDSILSEESGVKGEGDAFTWIVDPLDGTTNFHVGNPVFTTSVALAYRGEIVLGATYHPIIDQMFYVEKGRGFYLNGEKRVVSRVSRLEEAFVAFCHGADPKSVQKMIKAYAVLKPRCVSLRQMGAASFELALLASGRIDAFVMPGVRPWDVAAGVLMVKEAGGLVTDFTGREWSLRSSDLVASNGLIGDELLQII